MEVGPQIYRLPDWTTWERKSDIDFEKIGEEYHTTIDKIAFYFSDQCNFTREKVYRIWQANNLKIDNQRNEQHTTHVQYFIEGQGITINVKETAIMREAYLPEIELRGPDTLVSRVLRAFESAGQAKYQFGKNFQYVGHVSFGNCFLKIHRL